MTAAPPAGSTRPPSGPAWDRVGRRLGIVGALALVVLAAVLLTSGGGLTDPGHVDGPGLETRPGDVSVAELLAELDSFDGQVVSLRGEVIGEVLWRSQYAWVNIGDSGGVLGVWMTADMAKQIRYVGLYRYWGDYVAVTGVFHTACSEHGGDTDLHAESLEIVSPGRPRDITPSLGRWLAAAALLSSGLVLSLVASRTLREPAPGGRR